MESGFCMAGVWPCGFGVYQLSPRPGLALQLPGGRAFITVRTQERSLLPDYRSRGGGVV